MIRRSVVFMGARRAVVACGVFCGLYVAFVLSLVWRFPPFNDEGIYASWTAVVERDPSQRFVTLAGGKEPLLEWLAAVLVRLGVEPLTAVRLISVMAGVGIVMLVVVLGWWLGGARVAVVAAALGSVSPFLVLYGALGLYESLATFLVLAALVLQVLLAKTLRLDVSLGLGIVLGLAVLTKQSALVVFALWPLTLLCLDWSAVNRWRRVLRAAALAALALVLAAAISSLLYLTDFHDELVLERTKQPVHSVREALSHPLHWVLVNDQQIGVLVAYLSLIVVAAAIIGGVVGAWRGSRLTLVIAAWAIAPLLAAMLLTNTPFPRYVHAAAPPVIVLAAFGAVAAADWLRTRWPRSVGNIPVATVVILSLIVGWPALLTARIVAAPLAFRYPGLDDGQFITGWGAGTGWKTIARDLRKRAGTGPTTVMLGPRGNDWLALTLRKDDRFHFVRYDSDQAQDAVIAIQNGDPLPKRESGLGWKLVGSVPRPRNGTPLQIYLGGTKIRSTFATTPTELRAALAWDDARYDHYTHSHPAVQRWLNAYALAYPTAVPGS